jgi:hypothetical protein
VGIHVRIRVLDFAKFVEDFRREGVHLRDEFEEVIIREVFQGEFPGISTWESGNVPLCHVARVGLTEDGVAVAGDDTAAA